MLTKERIEALLKINTKNKKKALTILISYDIIYM